MNSRIGLSVVMIILRFLQIFNTYGKGDTDIFTNWMSSSTKNDPVTSSESEVNKESILNFWLD